MQLTQLFVYPIKSAHGIAVAEAGLTARGLEHDRRFMLVDADHNFLTQRQLPQMARLVPEIVGGALRVRWEQEQLEVPLTPRDGEPLRVRVWRDEVEALALGPEASAFFSQALGQATRLVYLPDASARQVDLQYSAPGDHVSFADGFPYLLANEASLADLNAQLAQPVPMSRFRPNLVIAGAPAYAEDAWREICIGDARFEVKKPCTRCAIITTDQETGRRDGKEPLQTLVRTRSWQGKPVFAQNLLCRDGGRLRRGDAVTVVA
ncbi:MAG TPA: MOSC N-terminal beta barrel domain-containing protein [Polyangiales bacterium]